MKLISYFQKFQIIIILEKLIIKFLIRCIRLYQSLSFVPKCRFHPSCSNYAILKIQQEGIKSLPKVIWRLLRCNPFAKRRVDL